MLKFKDGAVISGLSPGTLKLIEICNEVYNKQGSDCTVSSTVGKGIALRKWHIHDVEAIAVKLRRALGVGVEVMIGEKHIHIEKKPKGKKKCPIPQKQ